MINTSTATCRFSCFCSAQFHDDVGRVLERDQLATVGQHDRVLEWSAPALRHEFYRLLTAKDRPKAVFLSPSELRDGHHVVLRRRLINQYAP
jgi:hypothetical protein